MPTHIKPKEQEAINPAVDLPMLLLVGAVFLFVFGITIAMFSITYIQDMATLRNVPNLIWNFACGRPLQSDVTLPLLLTLSIISFIASGVLIAWRWWILRQ